MTFDDVYFVQGRQWSDDDLLRADTTHEIGEPSVAMSPFHFRNIKHAIPDLPTPSEMQTFRIMLQERHDAITWKREKQLLIKELKELRA